MSAPETIRESVGGGSRERTPIVALLGNPNTGKSTIFNRLTGLRQRIANYPGVTVEKKEGTMRLGGEEIGVVDLPGTYSLKASSEDERVVMDVLGGRRGGERPDVLIFVVDATNLKRNLVLVSQTAELGLPSIIALNQCDAARRNGVTIDIGLLSERLGVPVIETVATKGRGIDELRAAILGALENPSFLSRIHWPECVSRTCQFVQEGIRGIGGGEYTDAEALRLLFDKDGAFACGVGKGNCMKRLLESAHEELRGGGLHPASAEAVLHYRRLEELLDGVVKVSGPIAKTHESIDNLLLHRVWGTAIFLAVMYLVFQSLYSWAEPLTTLIEWGTGALVGYVSPLLESAPMLRSLVCEGMIAGVGGILVFLPQILILFFFIALLEDTGYMARAAFLMDKLFGWCGLNGKSFVPLLSSYACAIPGVMAARTLEDPKARLTTILMAPFMSCSARLPIYILLIGSFVEPNYGPVVAGATLFVVHFIGLGVALPLAWILNRFILRMPPQPFILEMPDYHVPTLRNIFHRMWESGREFALRAGTVILAFSVIVWALLYFPRNPADEGKVRTEFLASQGIAPAEAEAALADPGSELSVRLGQRLGAAQIEQSYLGRFGKAVQPVFAPAGFDWKITVGIVSSLPARELVIATMGILYSLGSEVDEHSSDLQNVIQSEKWTDGPLAGQPVYTMPVVCAIIVFFALCLQCVSTVAIMAKELSWRWAVGSFFGMTALAWVAAVVVYQIGRLL